jgi:hypothetical protein
MGVLACACGAFAAPPSPAARIAASSATFELEGVAHSGRATLLLSTRADHLPATGASLALVVGQVVRPAQRRDDGSFVLEDSSLDAAAVGAIVFQVTRGKDTELLHGRLQAASAASVAPEPQHRVGWIWWVLNVGVIVVGYTMYTLRANRKAPPD